MQQKIAVFVMSYASPKWASAVYEHGYLTFGEVKAVAVRLDEVEAKVKPSVVKLVNSGFKVLVDESNPHVTAGTGASSVTLSSKHHDNRPVLVAGLERYRELVRMGALTLPPKSGTRFTIPDEIVETEFNAAGDEVYRVNWGMITSDHVVVILACYATIYNPVATGAYIAAMNAGVLDEKLNSGLLAVFHRIIGKTTEAANPPNDESLAGRVIDENTRIL